MSDGWQTSVGALLRARTHDPEPALTWPVEDGAWPRVSWAEHVRRSAAVAAGLEERMRPGRPRHVGVLMRNTPEFSFLLGAAALAGTALVGLNPTRGAEGVREDARHTDCALVLAEPAFADLLDRDAVATHIVDGAWDLSAYGGAPIAEPGRAEADPPFMLILTSGRTAAPKAVVCSQGKVAGQGSRVARARGLGPDDVLYCAMPLFHSNAAFAAYLDGCATMPPLWRPRYVRVVAELPRTATHKVVVRTLAAQAWATSDPVYVVEDGGYRLFTGQDQARLVSEFEQHGRTAPGVR